MGGVEKIRRRPLLFVRCSCLLCPRLSAFAFALLFSCQRGQHPSGTLTVAPRFECPVRVRGRGQQRLQLCSRPAPLSGGQKQLGEVETRHAALGREPQRLDEMTTSASAPAAEPTR